MFPDSNKVSCQRVIVEELFPGPNVCVNERYLVRSKYKCGVPGPEGGRKLRNIRLIGTKIYH